MFRMTVIWLLWCSFGLKTTSSEGFNLTKRISEVKLECHVPQFVAVLEEVLVSASVTKLTKDSFDARFIWDFGDGTGNLWTKILMSNVTYSMASHKYGIAGDYVVRVTVSDSREPSDFTTVRLPNFVTVVEPIRDVYLRPLSGSFIVGLLIERTGKGVGGGGGPSSDPVTFEARTYHGSHVEFLFDYGDGTKEEISGEFDDVMSRPMPYAHGTHVYRNEGFFNVSVMARNQLGNRSRSLSEPFRVQSVPEGLKFERNYYVTSLGNVTFLRVILGSGTNVTYDWQLGNGVTFKNTGPYLDYAFPEVGTFKITVIAHNDVTRQWTTKSMGTNKATALVYILDVLQGVNLELLLSANETSKPKDRLVFATEQSVEFVATLLPTSLNHVGVAYVWSWGSSVERRRRTLIGRLQQTFNQPGRYFVKVTANNSISQVTSSEIGFDVVQKLDDVVRINHPGSIVLGEIATFKAQYWYGSNVTLVWDFGDGTEPATRVQLPSVTHTYKRLGEFVVTVKLTNVLSNANLSCTVFVLRQRCDKPQVKILPSTDIIKIRQSGTLRLEADVSVRCSSSSRVSYSWNVSNLDTATLRGRILALSARSLTSSNHTINLEVGMENTIVYTRVTTFVEIVADPFEVSIYGGTSRSVGRSETILLVSRIGGSDTKKRGPVGIARFYRWSCVPLESQQSDCFRSGVVGGGNSLSDSQQFQLITSRLNRGYKSFLFTVTAREADSVVVSTNQLIELSENSKMLRVSVTCHSCRGSDQMSKQRRIVLSTLCVNCVANVTYSWQVWLVLDGNHNLPLSEHDCVNPDGSTFFLNASSNPSENYDNFTSINDTSSYHEQIHFEPHRGYENQTFGSKDLNGRKKYNFPIESPSIDVNISHSSPDDFLVSSDPLEGFPGEVGRVTARRKMINGHFVGYNDEFGSETSTGVPSFSPTKGTVDKVLDSRYITPRIRHSFIREWKFVRLENEDTTTGFDRREFVINPDVLKVGRTYVIVAIAQMVNKDSGVVILQGKATQEVKVSMGPFKGRCSLMPTSGIEYETPFKLDCFEWKASEDETLFYELSYSLTPDHSNVLIYYGLDANFKFVLPSGLESKNSEIRLNVVVRQESGSATVVCSITRTVEKLANSSIVQLLSRELSSSSKSKIRRTYERGDLGSTLNRIQVVASMLNEDYFGNGSFVAFSKQMFYRMRMLKFVSKIELPTEAEALQLLQVVEEVYRFLELVDGSLLRSSLKSVRRAARFWWSMNTCGAFCESGLEILVEVVGLLVVQQQTISDEDINAESSVPMLILVQRAVAARLSSRLVDEESLIIAGDRMMVEGACFSTANRSLKLRWDAIEVSLVRLSFDAPMCVQAITSTVPEMIENAYSSMTSIQFTSYDNGLLLLSENNSFIGNVTLELSTYSVARVRSRSTQHDAFSPKRRLTTNLMGIHEFDVAKLERNMILSVVFHFERGSTTDIRSVLILVSDVRLPSLENSFYRQRLSSPFNDNYTFSFLTENLKDAGKYYIAVLDADYDSHRSISKSEKDLLYSVDVNRVDCLQWNINEATWSGSECEVRTSLRSLRCRCGVSLSYISKRTPISLTFRTTSFDHILRSRSNLLIPIVLIFIIGFYSFLFVLSYRKSRTEGISHVCGRVFLSDNATSDHHKYEVTLQTGHVVDGGTTAKVYIVLHGVNGITEPRELVAADNEEIFHCGSTNTFLLTSSSNLGRIWKIHIWHDNNGESPSWFLSYAVVKSLSTGEKFYYDCNKWFAVESDDCKIEREILLKETSWKFSEIFFSWFWFYRSFTAWSFVLSFSRYGHFMQIERILCSLLGNFVCSFFAAAWCYENSTEFATFFEMRQPSYELFVVGFVTSLIGYAAQVIIASLFHHAKLNSCKTRKGLNLKDYDKGPEETFETSNKNMKSSNLRIAVDEPIEKWQNLQHWAEKQWTKYLDPFSEIGDSISVGTDAVEIDSESTSNVDDKIEDKDERKCRSSFVLPFAFRVGVWVFCTLIVIATCVVTVTIGIRFSLNLSFIWFQLVIVGFTFSYFAITPTISLIAALFAATRSLIFGQLHPSVRSCCCSCGDEVLRNRPESLNRPSSECEFELKVAAMQRSRQLRFSRPPAETHLLVNRNATLKRNKVVSYFCELSLAFVVFAVICSCVFTRGNSKVYQLNKQLYKSFTNGKTVSFWNISSIETWRRWMKEEFISTAFGISDDVSFVKGTSSVILNGFKLVKNGVYDYMITENRLFSKERAAVKHLIESDDLNNDTKQISLEFVVYNVPTKLFSSVKLMSDFSTSSKAFIDSVLLSADDGCFDQILSLLKVCLFLMFFYELNFSMFEKCLSRSRNVSSFWKVCKFFSLVTMAAYLLSCVLYGFVSRNIIADFESRRNVDISLAVYLNLISSGFLGLSMLLHLVLSLRFLRIEFVFVRLGTFLRSAIKSLSLITAGFSILMISFSFCGSLWKSNGIWNLEILLNEFQSLFHIFTRNYRFESVFGLKLQLYVWFVIGFLFVFITCGLKFIVKSCVVSSSRSHVLNVTMDDFVEMFRKHTPQEEEEREKAKEKKTEISIEFILAELESRIEEMLFHTTQLCRYEGIDCSDSDLSQLDSIDSQGSQFTSVSDIHISNEDVDEIIVGFVNNQPSRAEGKIHSDGSSSSGAEDRTPPSNSKSNLGEISPSVSSNDIVLENVISAPAKSLISDRNFTLINHSSDKRFNNSCRKLRRSKTRGLSDLESDIRKAVESLDVS